MNARNNSGWTALHWASSKGRAEALRELLMHRPDVNAQGADGDTPLIKACSEGHLMAATALIGLGANLALLNNAGESALALAEALVEADDEEDEEEDEDEPASDAQREEHKLIVALLKGHGAT